MARLLPPESAAVDVVAREVGIGAGTLERWREDALSRPARGRAWTAAARLEAVITTAAMDEAGKSAWCREHGVYPAGAGQVARQCHDRAGRARGGAGQPAGHASRTAGASRSSSASCCARTGRWPRRRPCWCCQKKSRRSSTRARTNDRPRRSPSPGPRHRRAHAAGARLHLACEIAGIDAAHAAALEGPARASQRAMAGRRPCARCPAMP